MGTRCLAGARRVEEDSGARPPPRAHQQEPVALAAGRAAARGRAEARGVPVPLHAQLCPALRRSAPPCQPPGAGLFPAMTSPGPVEEGRWRGAAGGNARRGDQGRGAGGGAGTGNAALGRKAEGGCRRGGGAGCAVVGGARRRWGWVSSKGDWENTRAGEKAKGAKAGGEGGRRRGRDWERAGGRRRPRRGKQLAGK